jgi:hypothetical protein
VQVQGRTINPLFAVVAITVAALAVVGVLATLAARSAPDSRQAAAGNQRPVPKTVAQRKPATSLALPRSTGSGRRIVYASGIQRIWVVASNGKVQRTYAVRGEQPHLSAGSYRVYARRLTVPEPDTDKRHKYVLRIERGKTGGSLEGFCSVLLTRGGRPAKQSDQAGIEGGGSAPCVQQKVSDARFLWKSAPVGTRVVIVP